MANATNGKVVSLGDHARARSKLTPQESAGVMKDCRELALKRIVGSLSGMLDRIEDDLFELAEKSHDREAQNVYLDARAKARENRPIIESTFRSHFVEFFNRKVRGDIAEMPAPGPGNELSLLADEDLEGSIAVSNMARNLSNQCEGELYALSQRFGFLLQRPELKDDANPLSPATFCAALKDACDKVEANFKVRMALLHQFEAYVAADLQSVYHDLNAHLVQRHILPDIRPVARKNPRGPQPVARGPGAAGASGAAAGANTISEPGADVFRTLAQFLGTPQGGGVAPAGMPAGASGPGAVGAGLGAPAGSAPAGSTPGSGTPQTFLSELTKMHHIVGEADVPLGELVNVLRNLRSSPQVAALPSMDATTIDIVAMLFDYIFVDEDIPGNVKAMLGRLQIPLLKVALLDKAFFSSTEHPARKLVDRMAEAAIGLDERSVKGDATVRMIERTVQRVLDEFDTDFILFEKLLVEVNAFLHEQQRTEEIVVERTAPFTRGVLRRISSTCSSPAGTTERSIDGEAGMSGSGSGCEGRAPRPRSPAFTAAAWQSTSAPRKRSRPSLDTSARSSPACRLFRSAGSIVTRRLRSSASAFGSTLHSRSSMARVSACHAGVPSPSFR